MYPEKGRHSEALNDWTAANVPAAVWTAATPSKPRSLMAPPKPSA
jgi:hypothetical protein